ncbi:MAG: hypothetical protein RIT27_1727 [Pseudomonadota bacterium]|jgi:assimilatory nitrate reductase catalytic subunit
MRHFKSTCPYCGTGCGVVITREKNGQITIQGDKEHPANVGRLCSKGSALAETLNLEGRLLSPEINGQTTDWETTLSFMAQKIQTSIEQFGKESVAFYVSGQLLTEDYYVANKLMKGFIGTANIDTNSRLCMASSVAGHKRAFGTDTVAGCYEDVEKADLVVLVGSNLAWCHPVLFQRLNAAKQNRSTLKIIVIDPRKTTTCEIADLHLGLQAGTDSWLFNGLLNFLRVNDHLDFDFIEKYTTGFSETLKIAKETAPSIPQVSQISGLSEQQISDFYRQFSQTEKVVTIYSQGVNQSHVGTDKVNSIINCHLATGKIGKEGATPFSVTGQPNAMGGREVGGLANQLVAHLEFTEEHTNLVQRFWKSPTIAKQAGLKTVDLFQAVGEGKIKVLWIMATNPMVSLPDSNLVKKALEKCDCVIVSDCVKNTDTISYANVLLPALAWGEKEGTVTNSERCISKQQIFLETKAEAKPDWWIICEIAKRLGFGEYFNYQTAADIFREYAALSGFENRGTRDFNIEELSNISNEEYARFQPIQWSISNGKGTKRFFEDGKFFTPDQKARFIPITPQLPKQSIDLTHNFILNTGRVRDQWHTMTRTGKTARLFNHLSEPFVFIRPCDAQRVEIAEGSLVKIKNARGEIIVRAKYSNEQMKGTLFVPIHWNQQFSSHGTVNHLVAQITDDISGQPESKFTPVQIESYKPNWQGFLLTRNVWKIPDACHFWVKIRQDFGWQFEIAGETNLNNWREQINQWFGEQPFLEYQDIKTGHYRYGLLEKGRLIMVLFINDAGYALPTRNAIKSLFTKETLTHFERATLLTGQPSTNTPDSGETVCACFNVGKKTLQQAIQQQPSITIEQLGEQLKAGTNCGSCLPEIRSLLTVQK